MAPTLFENGAKPGDLIEINRGTYNHWAIFIGGNEVVHLIPPTNDGGDLGGFGALLTFLDSNKARVRRQYLWEVVGSDSFHVNNLLDEKYRPRDRREIVRDACKMVGRELPYNVATNNCEHFVTELRYGKSESRQVQAAAVMGGVATAGIAVAVLGAALFSAMHNSDKKRHNQ